VLAGGLVLGAAGIASGDTGLQIIGGTFGGFGVLGGGAMIIVDGVRDRDYFDIVPSDSPSAPDR
jgi:hypothetical protein